MTTLIHSRSALTCAALLFFCLRFAVASELLPPGHRPLPLGIHALVGGKVVTEPGTVLETATIVIRDGFIEAVGAEIVPPADARIWDAKGLTIYPGLIDPYLSLGAARAASGDGDGAAHFTSRNIRFFGVPGEERDPGTAGPGYEIAQITPERRVAQNLSPAAKTLEDLRELGFTAANIVPESGLVRGTSAFLLLSEIEPNRAIIRPDVFQHVTFDRAGGRDSGFPGSLMGVIAALRQTFFDAQHYFADHEHYGKQPRGRPRPEFNQALEALAPALDRRMPVVFEPGSALMIDRAGHLARELNFELILVSSGQEWRRPDLAKATGAPFIVPVNFPEVSKMPDEADWDDVSLDQLRAWDWAPENPALLRKLGLDIALTTHALGDRKSFRRNLQWAIDRGLSEEDALAALTTIPAKLCGVDHLLGTIEPGKAANLTVVEGNYFDPESKVREVWIDGRHYRGPLAKPTPAKADEKQEKEEQAGTAETAETADKPEKKDKKAELRETRKERVARAPLEGRGPFSHGNVLVRGGTIWTSGPEGVIEGGDVLIVDGKIQAVGKVARGIPANAMVIDAAGKHITPGLVDCHSHAAILGGVNESAIPSSAMVRISDVINSESANIRYQLAGGLTVANLLHGSANPIGGQNAVIKLRDGASPEGLLLEGAPAGIKFALGENVKQSNWGDRNITRFPQTRMGVRTFIANRFVAAQRYMNEWERFEKNGGPPPRRNLELEAIAEIIRGERWIHCHSYRGDEILMFLRLMEEFDVTIGTMQHVLEGYKVADEIAQHGAGASAFSDWWAYKFEVYDAIPHAGSLMRDRGVLVSFNSDSPDLARRMHLEAAKAVKFGGTPEEEALKFVTINPAKQLRIENRVGSLEPGKDGDFVIWSGPPLDSGTICLETWIEGDKYFDLKMAADRAAALEEERAALLAKAKKILGVSKDSPEEKAKSDEARAAFFRRALETMHSHVRECLDCEEF